MDAELKLLLTQLLNRLDGFEARLKKLEETAHVQVTETDLLRRFKEYGRRPSDDYFCGVKLC